MPISDYTKEVRGAKRAHITGKDDNRQLTAILTVTASGEMLPAQMIYGGQTPVCFTQFRIPVGWHITTFTLNHWRYYVCWHTYIHNILLLYVYHKYSSKIQYACACVVWSLQNTAY